MKICKIPDCKSTNRIIRELCYMHYQRWRKSSNFQISKNMSGEDKRHPLYSIYQQMKYRCYNSNCPNYNYYGGRGIKVDDRWLGLDGFSNFIADMGERPKNTSLNRIDNDGWYGPNNCNWATQREQNINRRVLRTTVTGAKGIVLKRDSRNKDRWYAAIKRDNKQKHLGIFDTKEEALQARKRAEIYYDRKEIVL